MQGQSSIPSNYEEIESYDVQHLPIIRAYLEKMAVVGVIDRGLDCEMTNSPGRIVIGLILDILSGRSPVYRVQDFFEHQDIELLVGQKMPLSAFGDDNIGRVLDRIFDYGTQKLFSEISIESVKAFDIDTSVVHSDTTSVNVWGDYEGSEKLEGPTITYGHSKDHRPDLKQFVFSLLSVEKNIPILGKTIDGKASDKTINNGILNHISSYMAKYSKGDQDFIYVADAALITPDNLELLKGLNDKDKTPFISRLPETYREAARVKKKAMESNKWTLIGKLAQGRPSQKRPHATYKSFETDVKIDGQDYRGVVIHSDNLDRRRQKKIDRLIKKDREDCEKVCKDLSKKVFMCEEDAKIVANEQSDFSYHCLNWTIKKVPIYKRGRPSSEGKRKLSKMTYVLESLITTQQEAIQTLREEAGCFVMISNISNDYYSAKDILETYKEQYGVEQNFGFLKDPLIVNDLFLKTPKRIEALGFVLLLALLVWRLLERNMRKSVSDQNIKIIGWNNRLTDAPTSFMMAATFCSVHILKLGDKRWFSRQLKASQLQFLSALSLTSKIYLEPG